MTLPTELVGQVRRRANFACEYCGLTETDAGGQLTVDHFRPRSHDGTDELANLVYCCPRCNLHKADYWPRPPGDATLWNPRVEPAANHLLLLANGFLLGITAIGTRTLDRLQLNREGLVAHRRRRQQLAEEARLLATYREFTELLKETNREQAELLLEQNGLLVRYREIVALLRKAKQ